MLHARRGSVPEEMPLGDFMTRCEAYFASDGCIIDQPFQPRLPDGMIRCYMGADKVVGFGHQFIKALIPPPPEGPDSDAAQPARASCIRRSSGAVSGAQGEDGNRVDAADDGKLLGIDAASLPIIWDADFLYGPRTASGEDTYVLCEINVSSVFAIPEQAPAAIARLTRCRLRRAGGSIHHPGPGGARHRGQPKRLRPVVRRTFAPRNDNRGPAFWHPCQNLHPCRKENGWRLVGAIG